MRLVDKAIRVRVQHRRALDQFPQQSGTPRTVDSREPGDDSAALEDQLLRCPQNAAGFVYPARPGFPP